MLTNLEYFSLFNYSPRGSSALSANSRQLKGAIKAKRTDIIEAAIDQLEKVQSDRLEEFFNSDTTLIPIPGSSPLVDGAIWLTELIAQIIVSHGLAKEVKTGLMRVIPLRKSSMYYCADDRPSVLEHFNSISFTPDLMEPKQITLIDDVVTLGRTSFACAQRIYEAHPDIPLKNFALIRTKGFSPINDILDPSFGNITYNPNSGKTTRTP